MKHHLLSVLLSLPLPAFAASPERVTNAVAELEKLATAEMAATGIPGMAIAVVHQDKIVFMRGFGVRETGRPEPVDADTVFLLASVSKPIGATVVASAVGDGKVSWDSRLSDLDPGFALSEPWVTREITVRDLYAHRSGLPDHAGDLLEDIGYSREEILHRLRHQQPDTSFRSGYAYTNFGMTAAAVAVARALGKSWEDLSEERLYRPLGMTSTSSRQEDFLARKNRARGHIRENGKWIPRFQRNPDAQSPAGGVSSSVNDLTKWLRLVLADGRWEGKPLIAQEALDESHHPHMLTGFNHLTGMPSFYGLGWNVGYDTEGRLRLSHSGAFAMGAATAVYLVPAEQLGIVVLTNAAPLGVAEAIGMTFLDLALYGSPKAEWSKIFRGAFARMEEADNARIADYSTPPASPAPASSPSSYEGVYSNDFFGDITVTEKNGRLILSMGPKPREFALQHWNRDIFTYESESETFVGTSGVFFAMGPDGHASGVTVENLNRLGQGTFVRKSKP
jgi:CubicO group peptidase (beta-lactamase class C family)